MLEQVDRYGADQFIKELKKVGADIVFLALDCYHTDKEKQKKVFASLKESIPLFKNAGFTVGVWVWTFMIREQNSFTHIRGVNGKPSKEQVCPSDKNFCDFACEYLINLAKCKPDIILFDDDFRYGSLDCGLGCTCKSHRAYMENILGEKLPEGDLSSLIFKGGRNKYRSAFLRANGHYFREFAALARAAVDSVDPNIRLGICACSSTWDFDGVSAAELSHILAGKTKPFLRLIGAPYWFAKFISNCGNRVAEVIELERMESSWCDKEIEIFSEGDSYPRPRFVCPASYLEGFDTALRASGATDGIHKYLLDYNSDAEYETGYVKKHLQNQEIYKQIDRCFEGKTCVGVRVYEHMTKFENINMPEYYPESSSHTGFFFSPAAELLSAQTIPTVYDGLGTVGIAFGDNAKYLDAGALENGLILDIRAAQILQATGIDVGLLNVGEEYAPDQEYFPDKKRYVGTYGFTATDITVRESAKIHSVLKGGERESIGSYSYENAAGQKFLVFAFDMYRALYEIKGGAIYEHAMKQYARGEQIEAFITSLGKKLPASMKGNPGCYMLCKEGKTGKSVWIGNFFADECMNTTVILDKEYSNIEFINCSGRLVGNRVELDRIGPFSYLGFSVS